WGCDDRVHGSGRSFAWRFPPSICGAAEEHRVVADYARRSDDARNQSAHAPPLMRRRDAGPRPPNLYRVPEIVTLGRLPGEGESDSRWRTKEVRHVGSDTLTPGF